MSIFVPSPRNDTPTDVAERSMDTAAQKAQRRNSKPSDSWLQTTAPSEVNNVELYWQAWQLIDQHQPAHNSQQACAACGKHWPCEPYQRGQVDEVASRRRL